MNLQPITVAQFGIGPIGAEITRLLLTKPWVKLVAAVDIDPAKVGRDVGEVVGLARAGDGRIKDVGVKVTSELDVKADVVCHSTGSRLRDVASQLRMLLERGAHVVSTCEELSFPLDAEIRAELQHAARAHNVTLLGTGVNPGFVMDKLPLTITSVCQRVDSVQIIRIQNASTRREPLQRKVGAGMTTEEFRAAVESGKIKHMGLRESLMLVGNGLGVDYDSVSDEVIQPIVAEREIVTQYLKVAPGQVAGVHQTIFGKGKIDVSLELRMYVGAEDVAADRVIVKGVPNVEMEIKEGVHGDRATAAMVVNSIPRIVSARPGVLTMDDIPISYR
jgi:4-hydroxy-tetrahydrodipicolinate reductase